MQIIRKQWSKDEPQIFAASRTQVNINIKPQVQNIEGVETAYCEGDELPEYATEITVEEMPSINRV